MPHEAPDRAQFVAILNRPALEKEIFLAQGVVIALVQVRGRLNGWNFTEREYSQVAQGNGWRERGRHGDTYFVILVIPTKFIFIIDVQRQRRDAAGLDEPLLHSHPNGIADHLTLLACARAASQGQRMERL